MTSTAQTFGHWDEAAGEVTLFRLVELYEVRISSIKQTVDVQSCCVVSVLIVHFYKPWICCNVSLCFNINSEPKSWLGLGSKTTWLGLGRDHALPLKYWFCHYKQNGC